MEGEAGTQRACPGGTLFVVGEKWEGKRLCTHGSWRSQAFSFSSFLFFLILRFPLLLNYYTFFLTQVETLGCGNLPVVNNLTTRGQHETMALPEHDPGPSNEWLPHQT